MKSGGSNQKLSVTRRDFLRTSGLAAGAVGLAPALSAPFVSKALAADTAHTIVQWSHFVPAYDTWFDKFAKDWGEKNKVAVAADPINEHAAPARAAVEASAGAGHDLFGWNGGASGAHLYKKFLVDLKPLVEATEKKYGKATPIGTQIGYNRSEEHQ